MIQSVYHLLQETANTYKGQVAAKYRRDGKWQEMTWSELEERVHAIASGLIELGVKPHDRVAILSKTRVEWTIADLAISAAGGCTVPIYHSSTPHDIAYILNDSGSRFIFVDDDELLVKMRQITGQVSKVEKVIAIDLAASLSAKGNEIGWLDVFDKKVAHRQTIAERVALIQNEDLASIVYTSGTTGEPKGAMLTHDNLMYEARAIEKLGLVSTEDVQLLFLPLAHVFAKVLQIAWLKTAHVLFYAESLEKVMDNMKDARPTIMAAVPRVYEKVYAKVVANAEATPGLKRLIAKWAFKQSEMAANRQKANRAPSSLTWSLAQRLVFDKIRTRLAETFGGRLRFFISGGAPLSPDIAYFFKHAGVTILEGYGLTETTAATCVNLPSHNRIGTVGKPVPGTEIKIAPDGEILVRGRGVFKGYWNRPQESAKSLSKDGWFHTGDVGVLDQAGFLRITDRKKEIIVTAGGKKIAPQKIENLLKSKIPLVSNVLVFGDERPYLVALLAPDEGAVKDWAKQKRLNKDLKELSQHKDLKHEVQEHLKVANASLASYEQVKKFAILDHDFVVGEELTPTLKVKRNFCAEQYKEILEELYTAS